MADAPPQPAPWGASATPIPAGATASAGGTPASHVPAPTIDVQVRTMASDLASLSASGGNMVSAETIALQVKQSRNAVAGGTHRAARTVFATIVSVIVLGALVFAGYVLYHRLVQSPAAPNAVQAPASDGTDVPAAPSATAAILVQELPGAHVSLLKQPAASRAVLALHSDPVSDPSMARTYNQTLRDTLRGIATPDAELEVQNSSGQALSFQGFLDTINAPLIDTAVFQENFEPDFTFFVLKEGQEAGAAYVVRLRAGKNWLFVKNDIAKVETAPGLETLFPTVPGLRDVAFKDSALREQPIRTLNYTNPDAQFVYGWFRDYLVLATSPAALDAALTKLCFFGGSC